MAARGLTLIYDNASPVVRIAVVVPNQVSAVSIASARVVPSRAAVHEPRVLPDHRCRRNLDLNRVADDVVRP